MPLVARAVRDFFDREPRRDLLGDEVVAIGAAVLGYALGTSIAIGDDGDEMGRSRRASTTSRARPGGLDVEADWDVLLLDVLPHTVGIEGPDDSFETVLHRNSKLPCHARHVLVLPYPGAGEVLRIRVLQGESPRASDNTRVGEVILEDVGQEDGKTRIELQVRVDASGLLQLRAEDLVRTGAGAVTLESSLPPPAKS